MTIALLLVGGLVLLVVGGETLVRGAVGLARRMGVSPLVIGLTIVGFGTSAPELVTVVQAAMVDAAGVAVGNVVGSNIANMLLIMGFGALLVPIACDPAAIRRDGSMVAVVTVLCVGIVLMGSVGRSEGVGLIALLLAYTLFAYFSEKKQAGREGARITAEADSVAQAPDGLLKTLAILVFGIVATVIGAGFLVDGAVTLARVAGVSEAIIGLTIVAVGTSLPELVVALAGALRGGADVAFGNILGSSIFNVLGILGVAALVSPFTIPEQIGGIDIWIMLGVTVVFLVFAATGRRISRSEGGLLLAGYAIYLGLQGYLALG